METRFDSCAASLEDLFRQGDSKAQEKEEERLNVQLIQKVFLAIGQSDYDALGEFLARDVRLDIKAPLSYPFVREAQGKDQFLEVVRKNFGSVHHQRPVVRVVVAQGDTVILLSREEGEFRQTGERYQVDGVHRFVCRGGQIALLEELIVAV
jgi:ketosteroid isomerase-like protein